MALLRPVVAAASPTTGVVASATRLSAATTSAILRRTRLPWQERAFAYYDLLGEIWYASQFYARALAKLDLRLVRFAGTDDEEDVTDANLLSYLSRIQDPGGGRANLLATYGRLKFLAGECYLLVTRKDDVEEWEVVSCDELRVQPNTNIYQRFRLPGGKAEEISEAPEDQWEPIDGDAIAYRFWTRHPRYSDLADAPMRGVLDLCEELLILQRAVRSRARSRVAGAGILIVPEEVSFAADTAGVPDEDADADPFLRALTEAMMTPISDEGAASAVVPIVIRVGAQHAAGFQHLQIHDPTQTYPETGLRMECIQRIAIGLDLPPEILLGKSDANHWSAWQIGEDEWKAHLEPVARALVDDLTGGYLRPTMRAEGITDADEYSILYDASAVVNHPDRTRDAKDLHDRLVISDDSLRGAAGFDDDDAPDDEEYLRRVGLLLKDTSLATGDEVPDPVQVPGPPIGMPVSPGEGPGGVEPGPPEEPSEEADVALVASLIMDRAREIAGARLRTKYAKDKTIARLLDGVPNPRVAATIGRHLNGDITNYDLAARELVAGAGDCFKPTLLRRLGYSDEAANALILRCEQRAAEELFA